MEGETGFIMDYADTIGVANRVSQLLDHPEQARQMGIRAADRIRQRFSHRQRARMSKPCLPKVNAALMLLAC